MCFTLQPRAIFRHYSFKKCSEHFTFCAFSLQNARFATVASIFAHENFQKCSHDESFLLQNVCFATAVCNFCVLELPKVLPPWGILFIVTSKCAFRHSGKHFFDIASAKSAPKLTSFIYFHFRMCLSPQRRAIFDFSSEHLLPYLPL